MANKKNTLKSNLIKKKPVITEAAAKKVVKQVHDKKPQEAKEETVKTSVEIEKSLWKGMKIKMAQMDIKTMREYLENLIKTDLNT